MFDQSRLFFDGLSEGLRAFAQCPVADMGPTRQFRLQLLAQLIQIDQRVDQGIIVCVDSHLRLDDVQFPSGIKLLELPQQSHVLEVTRIVMALRPHIKKRQDRGQRNRESENGEPAETSRGAIHGLRSTSPVSVSRNLTIAALSSLDATRPS